MKPQFNVRTLLVLTLFVAILAGWWVDRRKLQTRNDSLKNSNSELTQQSRRLNVDNILLEAQGYQIQQQTLASVKKLLQQSRLLEREQNSNRELKARLHELEFKYETLSNKVLRVEGLAPEFLFPVDDKATSLSTAFKNQARNRGE